eukprot:2481789-Rhodomonas_salina.1
MSSTDVYPGPDNVTNQRATSGTDSGCYALRSQPSYLQPSYGAAGGTTRRSSYLRGTDWLLVGSYQR